MISRSKPEIGSNESTLKYTNYDEFVETASGKDALHDTVRIAYQICEEDFSNHGLLVYEEIPQSAMVDDTDLPSVAIK